jgi:preprotein translocase subunit SecD
VLVAGGARSRRTHGAKRTGRDGGCQITVEEALQARVPSGYQIYSLAGSKDNKKLLLREIPFVRGGEMSDAEASFDARTGEPIISFRLNAEARVSYYRSLGTTSDAPLRSSSTTR